MGKRDKKRYDTKEILKRLQKFKEVATLGSLITSRKDTRYNERVDSLGSGNKPFYYNKWTLLKLMFIQLYTPLYTSIIEPRYGGFNYLDLFAGSGANKLENSDIIIAGSPIIALSFASSPFTKAYLVENNPLKLEMLKRRVEYLTQLSRSDEHREYIFSNLEGMETSYYSRDVNEVISNIYDEIEEKSSEMYNEMRKGLHNLVFIDPYGLEFHFKSLLRILSSWVRNDIILFFNSYTLGIQAHNYLTGRVKSAAAIEKAMGSKFLEYIEEKRKNINTAEENVGRRQLSKLALNYYTSIFKEHKYITVEISLPTTKGNATFDVIYACKRTSGGNQFIEGVKYIKDLLLSTDYELIDSLQEYVLRGELPGLLKFLVEDPDKALEKYKTSKRYGIGKRKDRNK